MIMQTKDTWFFGSLADNLRLFWTMMFCVLVGDIGCAAGTWPKGFVYLREVDPPRRRFRWPQINAFNDIQ
jgi:hypothetical protein